MGSKPKIYQTAIRAKLEEIEAVVEIHLKLGMVDPHFGAFHTVLDWVLHPEDPEGLAKIMGPTKRRDRIERIRSEKTGRNYLIRHRTKNGITLFSGLDSEESEC